MTFLCLTDMHDRKLIVNLDRIDQISEGPDGEAVIQIANGMALFCKQGFKDVHDQLKRHDLLMGFHIWTDADPHTPLPLFSQEPAA